MHDDRASGKLPGCAVNQKKRRISCATSPCIGLNDGPAFKHSEAFSFQVATDNQAETDRLWNAIVSNGGQASECDWCKDKWGLSWQITPRSLPQPSPPPQRPDALSRR